MAKKAIEPVAAALKQEPAQKRAPVNGKAAGHASGNGKSQLVSGGDTAPAFRLRKLRQEKRDLVPAWKLRPEVDLTLERKRKQVGKKSARKREIERIVQGGLKCRRAELDTIEILRSCDEVGTIRSLPRRKATKTAAEPHENPPIYKDQRFQAGVFATAWRCVIWIKVILVFQLGVLWDKIRKRDSIETRAVRFYHLFQSAGGSFTKIGQQLAMRLDLFPYEYCRELSKLLDNVAPFPTDEAVAIIERAAGKKIGESFAAFDPKPIGSATIACVYQAVLKSGERVAVKVRRPHIGHVFAADLRAMRWMVSFLETFALIRQGYMDNFLHEFSSTILDELDFRMEAYHQAMFRREAKKNKIGRKNRFSAPKVFFNYSNQEVLVQEFVTGIWMTEVLSAVDHRDSAILARMRQLNINTKDVAENLYWVSLWSQLVAPMFHADPHPANILVQEDSKLVFIDFGACGALSKAKQKLAQEFVMAHARKDVAAVVRCCVAFMEPLPPVDLHNVLKELEMSFSGALHRMWSKHAPWYEKNSAGFYFRLFEVTRKYDIPVNLDMVRAFRANMLYDTLAVRIHPELDPIDGMRDFLKDISKYIKRSAAKSVRKRLAQGLVTGEDISMFNDIRDITERGLAMARRFIDRPQFSLNYMIEKSVFSVMEFVQLLMRIIVFTVFGAGAIIVYRYKYHLPIEFKEIAPQLLMHPVYIALCIFPVIISIRRIMMRLGDSEV